MNRLERWLVLLCDPETAPTASLPPRLDGRDDLEALLRSAGAHGVLPAVAANLKALAEKAGAAEIVGAARGGPFAGDAMLSDALTGAREQLIIQAHLAMVLRRQCSEVRQALQEQGIESIVLKGPDFADRLYPPGLRTFRDLDLMVPSNLWDQAQRTVAQAGYAVLEHQLKYAQGYGQSAWRRTDGADGTVELHWNLVNSPAMRRGLSLELGDLSLEPAPGEGANRPTPAAALLLAAVHAAFGHGFDRLVLLCDIRQLVRGRAGAIDEQWLRSAARRGAAALALRSALGLCGRVFAHRPSLDLMRRLPAGGGLCRRALARALVTRRVALRSAGGWGSLCRQGFRELLKRA